MDDSKIDNAWMDFADAYGFGVDEMDFEYTAKQKYNMLLREFKGDANRLKNYLKEC